MQEFINGVELQNAFLTGYLDLKKNMSAVNDLNVFPVPDGDTGTNMVHTFSGSLSIAKTEHVGQYMSQLSMAVLMSARGNSGVIFSQFFHGIGRSFADKDKVCFADFADAFRCAQEDAYKAISTPTEGTMLTVIREAADYLAENDFSDFRSGLDALLHCMRDTLSRTPLMLPILKEAGVVDSGGAGLVCFFEGMLSHFNGESIEDLEDISVIAPAATINASSFGPDSEMEYGYCTECLIQLMNAKVDIPNFSIRDFVAPLEKMGDSIVAVENSGIVKLHIHTFAPENILAYARKFGEFINIKIENMSIQHSELQSAPQKEHIKYMIVAVASGKGIVDYFYSIGANVVIDGGQTNNPSVDDFIEAFEKYDAEHIVVLPNNSNIILAANQAAQLYSGSDVRVIPTKSVVEGYSALSMMNLWCDTVDELIEDMSSGLDSVTAAYVTTATRDTNMCSLDIKKGNYIGLKAKDILVCGEDRAEVSFNTIRTITEEVEKEVVILFYGAQVSEKEAMALKDRLREAYPLMDIGLISGEQAVYDYIISLE